MLRAHNSKKEGRTLTEFSKSFLNRLVHPVCHLRACEGQYHLLKVQLRVFRDSQALCITSLLRGGIFVPKTSRAKSLLPCVVQIDSSGGFRGVIGATDQVKPFDDESRELLRFQLLKLQAVRAHRATQFRALVFTWFRHFNPIVVVPGVRRAQQKSGM